MERRDINITIEEFNASMGRLMTMLGERIRSDAEAAKLERVRWHFNLAKGTMKEAIISQITPIIIGYDDIILCEDSDKKEQFLKSVDIDKEISRLGLKGFEADAVRSLFEPIKNHFFRATAKEKEKVYEELTLILRNCLEWQLYIEERKRRQNK